MAKVTKKASGVTKRPPKITAKVEEPELTPTKPEGKYLKIKETESRDSFKTIGDRVQHGELQWSHYTTDNGIGTHHYLIKKKA